MKYSSNIILSFLFAIAHFGTAYALHADRQGSIIAVTDQATGTLAARYKYDAFGAREQTVSLVAQPYGFTGREYDPEASLYHYRARTYDPAVGRFLQSDPLGFAAGDLNIYAYTWNDPANWTDPSGLSAAGATAEFMMYGHAVVAVVGEAAVCLANKISTALSSIGTLLEEGRNIGDLEKVNAGECVTAFVAPRLKRCGCGGAGGKRGGRNSFPAGTEVLTPTGPVAIESLREGDLVVARNEDTGVSGVFPVTALMAHQASEVLWLTLESEDGSTTRMGVTATHPLFIAGIGWGEAGELVAGDAIRDKDLNPLTVLAVEIDTTPQMVHNLEIADAHTYFAGELEAWGHNAWWNMSNDPIYPRKPAGPKSQNRCQAYDPVTKKYIKQELSGTALDFLTGAASGAVGSETGAPSMDNRAGKFGKACGGFGRTILEAIDKM